MLIVQQASQPPTSFDSPTSMKVTWHSAQTPSEFFRNYSTLSDSILNSHSIPQAIIFPTTPTLIQERSTGQDEHKIFQVIPTGEYMSLVALNFGGFCNFCTKTAQIFNSNFIIAAARATGRSQESLG